MLDFYTYSMLSSMTGAVTETVLVVEFLKNFGALKRLPVRWLVLLVAEGIVVGTSMSVGHFVLASIPLYGLNGLLVAASAAASWQVVYDHLFVDGKRNHGVR